MLVDAVLCSLSGNIVETVCTLCPQKNGAPMLIAIIQQRLVSYWLEFCATRAVIVLKKYTVSQKTKTPNSCP